MQSIIKVRILIISQHPFTFFVADNQKFVLDFNPSRNDDSVHQSEADQRSNNEPVEKYNERVIAQTVVSDSQLQSSSEVNDESIYEVNVTEWLKNKKLENKSKKAEIVRKGKEIDF